MSRNRMSIFSRLTHQLTGPGRLPEATRRRRTGASATRRVAGGCELLSTLTVTTPADHGSGTLGQAITLANSGDTIQFSPTLNGQTISLTSGELKIAKSLNIQGPGSTDLAVAAAACAFDITTPGAVVTISGLVHRRHRGVDGAEPSSTRAGT